MKTPASMRAYALTVVLLPAVVAVTQLAAFPASANQMTYFVDLTAEDFVGLDQLTLMPNFKAPPTDPVLGGFTITFDPTLIYLDITGGIGIGCPPLLCSGKTLNIALDSALSFDYGESPGHSATAPDTLIVGGIDFQTDAVGLDTNDFVLVIDNFTSDHPTFDEMFYTQTSDANSGTVFRTIFGFGTIYHMEDGSSFVFSAAAVPEPATWALMLTSLCGFAFGFRLLQFRQRS